MRSSALLGDQFEDCVVGGYEGFTVDVQSFFDPRNEEDQADAAVANDVPNRIKPVAALEIRGCKPVFVD